MAPRVPNGSGVTPRTQSLSYIINHACAKEELCMGILDELTGGGQRQKEDRDFVDRYEQGDPRRVIPIKRFSSGMVMCHTPCRRTSTLRRR